MTKAIVNSLTLALVEEWGELDGQTVSITLRDARDFAARWVEENADLLSPEPSLFMPAMLQQAPAPQPVRAAPTAPVGTTYDTKEAAYGTYVPVVGPDGLTEKQRAAVGKQGLCPNCQQPTDDHLPACARQSGEDPKAVTKKGLPPAV